MYACVVGMFLSPNGGRVVWKQVRRIGNHNVLVVLSKIDAYPNWHHSSHFGYLTHIRVNTYTDKLQLLSRAVRRGVERETLVVNLLLPNTVICGVKCLVVHFLCLAL